MTITAASLSLVGTVSAGCPFAQLHKGGGDASSSHGGNPHHPTAAGGPTQQDLLAANQHSLNVHHTPLVHFKIPPINRQASTVHMEGGVLVEKKKKETTEKATSEEDGRKLQEGDTIAYLGEYASGDPSYSNQNVGDGYAIPEGTLSVQYYSNYHTLYVPFFISFHFSHSLSLIIVL